MSEYAHCDVHSKCDYVYENAQQQQQHRDRHLNTVRHGRSVHLGTAHHVYKGIAHHSCADHRAALHCSVQHATRLLATSTAGTPTPAPAVETEIGTIKG